MEYTYCPKCAGKLKTEAENLFVCTKCNFNFYNSPKPCNCAILVNDQDDILLVERKYDPQKGMWDLPGGFIDPFETFEEGTAREIKEELGIIVPVSKLTYVGSYADRYVYEEINYHTVANVYWSRIATALTITPTDDVASVKFFTKDELKTIEFAFPSGRVAVEDYLKK